VNPLKKLKYANFTFHIFQNALLLRHLEFIRIEDSAIRSAVPENPTIEQNVKWIGRPVAEISPIEIFSNMAEAAILNLFES